MLQLFVYGSLKRGFHNHANYVPSPARIEDARVWGRLYGLKYGFPALEIAPQQVLLNGSGDPESDLQQQRTASPLEFARPEGDWDLVHGELVTLVNPRRDLPAVDRLEAFRPGRRSLYQRSLVPVQTDRGVIAGWVYWMHRVGSGQRLRSGRWE
ncbi:MAG: gamma-glutamylcyclotransferase [Haliea sp.]|nr:gamma-glutamylcyclotransferase [Haliea sp.]